MASTLSSSRFRPQPEFGMGQDAALRTPPSSAADSPLSALHHRREPSAGRDGACAGAAIHLFFPADPHRTASQTPPVFPLIAIRSASADPPPFYTSPHSAPAPDPPATDALFSAQPHLTFSPPPTPLTADGQPRSPFSPHAGLLPAVPTPRPPSADTNTAAWGLLSLVTSAADTTLPAFSAPLYDVDYSFDDAFGSQDAYGVSGDPGGWPSGTMDPVPAFPSLSAGYSYAVPQPPAHEPEPFGSDSDSDSDGEDGEGGYPSASEAMLYQEQAAILQSLQEELERMSESGLTTDGDSGSDGEADEEEEEEEDEDGEGEDVGPRPATFAWTPPQPAAPDFQPHAAEEDADDEDDEPPRLPPASMLPPALPFARARQATGPLDFAKLPPSAPAKRRSMLADFRAPEGEGEPPTKRPRTRSDPSPPPDEAMPDAPPPPPASARRTSDPGLRVPEEPPPRALPLSPAIPPRLISLLSKEQPDRPGGAALRMRRKMSVGFLGPARSPPTAVADEAEDPRTHLAEQRRMLLRKIARKVRAATLRLQQEGLGPGERRKLVANRNKLVKRQKLLRG
ncbi:hypothetical protein DFJ74DRAFT_656851 [Hyaloraphidium curvatum]|nr:hypothetical protein DFJ74DRAFT_656851 [Hyaloraphidium curvatum]